MEYLDCKLCHNGEYELFKEIGGYKLVKCRSCGLVYLNPRPSQKEIKKIYANKYVLYEKKADIQNKQIEEEINKRRRRCEKILGVLKKKAGRVLDIGCGRGFFIACMKRYGWEVAGIDISESACDFAMKYLGLNIHRGIVEDMAFKEDFDLITMSHLFEHLPDPVNTLKKISQLMSKDGMLVVAGPNFGSFDRWWHGVSWEGYKMPSHLYYLTPQTYCAFLEKAGFRVVKIEYEFWNPITHLQDKLKNGKKNAHIKIKKSIKKSNDNFMFKCVNKIMAIFSRCINLRGRDLVVYARKKCFE